MPGLAHQLGVGDDAERAVRKVRSQGSTTSSALGDGQVLVDPIGWYRSPDEVPHLPAIADAMRSCHVVTIRYRRWVEPAEVRRRVHPLGLVLKAGTWYLMARSRGQIRTYRVDQIVNARVMDETFAPDATFDLAASWAAFVMSFRARLHVIDAEVRVTRAVRDWIRSEGDPALCDALDVADGGAPDHDGERVVTLPYESIERAAAELLRYGLGVEVLGPRALRELVSSTVAHLSVRYGGA